MKKRWLKITVIIALLCLFCGTVLIFAGYRLNGRTGVWVDKDGIHSYKEYHERRMTSLPKTKLEPVHTIRVNLTDNDLVILPSEDDAVYLEYELVVGRESPTYECGNGALSLEYENNRSSYAMGLFVVNDWEDLGRGYAKIYVPEGTPLTEVLVSNSDGEIRISQLDTDTLTVDGGYGRVTLNDIRTDSLEVTMSDAALEVSDIHADRVALTNAYGKTSLNRVDVTGEMKMTCSDGAVTLSNISAAGMVLKNSYGSLEGTGLKAQDVSVTMSDGNCRITGLDVNQGIFENQYGSMELQLAGKESDYRFDLRTSYGSMSINDRKLGEDDISYQANEDAKRSITSASSDGKLMIHTEQ